MESPWGSSRSQANGKAVGAGYPDGFIKVITNKARGEIVGVHAIGHGVTDLIAEMSLAITSEATAHDVLAAYTRTRRCPRSCTKRPRPRWAKSFTSESKAATPGRAGGSSAHAVADRPLALPCPPPLTEAKSKPPDARTRCYTAGSRCASLLADLRRRRGAIVRALGEHGEQQVLQLARHVRDQL